MGLLDTNSYDAGTKQKGPDLTNSLVKYRLLCKCNETQSYLPPKELLDHKPWIITICKKCLVKPFVMKYFVDNDVMHN